MAEKSPIDVFISSTCYDLADLCAELASFLKERGLIVRVSEDPESAFYIEPRGDSIVSCLKNVEESRAVIAIIDRRYGPTLRDGTAYAGMSATKTEIGYAQRIGKPVFFFIREAAHIEYDRLKRDEKFDAKWVEPTNRHLWRRFLMNQFLLPQHANRSNWYDLFKNSTDLKGTVLCRLIQQFPEYAGSLAMHPDRMVRMTYLDVKSDTSAAIGRFRNVGRGSALRVCHGICTGGTDAIVGGNDATCSRLGGLLEGECAVNPDESNFGYDLRSIYPPMKLYCEYENRFGDRYRVEVPFKKVGALWTRAGSEYLYVWHSNGAKWLRAD